MSFNFITGDSSVGRATDCSSFFLISVGHWFDSDSPDILLSSTCGVVVTFQISILKLRVRFPAGAHIYGSSYLGI